VELLADLAANTSGPRPMAALQELVLQNVTIHDAAWEVLCAAAQPGGRLPMLSCLTAHHLLLSHSHAGKPCGSLQRLDLVNCG
jgi:hypothetical protein